MSDTPTSGVRALSTAIRTMELLKLFANSDRPLQFSEVVALSGLSRATAYQRLLTLIEADFLEIDADQRYRLSLFPARLAHAATMQAGFAPRAEPVMTQLLRATGETVSLAVLDRNRPCIIARVETNMLLRAEQKIGSYMSLAGSASGRILAAFSTPQMRQQLLASDETFPDEEVLEQARALGYAVSSGYSSSGVVGIAAPVFGPDGRCMGALSLVIPEQRYQLEQFRDPVKDAAARLSSIFMGGNS